jgi:hypothetical protein
MCSRARRCAISASTPGKLHNSFNTTPVTNAISISRRLPRASASAGVSHTLATVSALSCAPCCPTGTRATKKRVSKRRGRIGGVIQ